MSERAKRIEECARALLDGSEGVKLSAGTAEVMNYWNRYRGLRAALRAALSTPAIEGGDEYRRGVEDAARLHDAKAAEYRERARRLREEEPDRTMIREDRERRADEHSDFAAWIRNLAPGPRCGRDEGGAVSACLNPDCIQECGTLRGQIRDLQRTVAFFASVIKSGESWSEDCEKAWPVTLEPCVHDFHRAEHGVMPCTKCGAEAHADAIRALAPAPGAATGTLAGSGAVFCDPTTLSESQLRDTIDACLEHLNRRFPPAAKEEP